MVSATHGASSPQSTAPQGTRPEHRVLVVDDDLETLVLVRAALRGITGLNVHGASNVESAVEAMVQLRPGLVLLDLVMPGVEGMELLEKLLSIEPHASIVLVTAHYSTDSAVEAIQKGASDYVTKPLPVARLRSLVENWLDQARREDAALELEAQLAEHLALEGIVGRSGLMLALFSQIRRIAPHFSNVLVTGQTGTGKELIARALHQLSRSNAGPFVVCNCAAITESLFESELFGHMRGSFTGAVQDQRGMIEHAAGGTLFLDEIGEVPLTSQAKLLRFLQNREVQRIGDPRQRKVDVRIVAATNRDLSQLVCQQLFREDLYYRLSMAQLHVPSLAERKEDLPLLVRHFLEENQAHMGRPRLALTRRAEAMVQRYHWPGNVRELQNALSFSAMMCESDLIDVVHFPKTITGYLQNQEAAPGGADFMTLAEMERRYVQRVLDHVCGNRALAARILGVGRATIYRMLAK